jgi:hypothetical protein
MLNEFEFFHQQTKEKLRNLVDLLGKNVLHGLKKFTKKDAADLESIIL